MVYKHVKDTDDMPACHLAQVLKRARCTRCHKVKGEVAVTAGFVPFKVPGSPVVDKTVFPSPLSETPQKAGYPPKKRDTHMFRPMS